MAHIGRMPRSPRSRPKCELRRESPPPGTTVHLKHRDPTGRLATLSNRHTIIAEECADRVPLAGRSRLRHLIDAL
jgi:hypothetical protein